MAGTIPLSMTQQFDEFGQPLAGGQLFLYQAGTVATPQNPYSDAGLSIVMPNPITLDAAGRIPQFFLADGYIKIRLADVMGVTQLSADGILVIGPSAGGGGGGSVDPTTIFQTGDVKPRYDTSVNTGWVRLNGRTIGSAASGATEFADNTAQALFTYLWNKDPALTVLPSRGASAASDWAANRQITLPDFRGCVIAGLDDMGNTAAGRLTTTFYGNSPLVLGNIGGTQSQILALAQLPAGITSAGTFTGLNTISVNSSGNVMRVGSTNGFPAGVGFAFDNLPVNSSASNNISVSGTVTSNNTGGTAHSSLQPTRVVTIYIKL